MCSDETFVKVDNCVIMTTMVTVRAGSAAIISLQPRQRTYFSPSFTTSAMICKQHICPAGVGSV